MTDRSNNNQNDDQITLPPHNEDIEARLLGSILLNPDVMLDVSTMVGPSHFWRESHRHIAKAIWQLHEDGDKIDSDIVLQRLEASGKLPGKVAPMDVVRLADNVASSANADAYAKIIREAYVKRTLIRTCEDVSRKLYADGEYDSEHASDALDDVAKLARSAQMGEVDYGIKRHTQDFYKVIERRANGETVAHYSTGIDVIDDREDFVDVFTDQRLIGIASKPKMGKSRLATAISSHYVREHGFAADVWYTDGPGFHWPRDTISRLAKVDTKTLEMRPQLMGENQWAAVTKHMGEVSQWDVKNYDIGGPHVRDIVMNTKKRLSELDGDKKLVLQIDYIQNCKADGDTDLERAKNKINALRELRTDHKNLIILCLMQFNRGSNKQDMPSPDQLKGTSKLEEALDALFVWHRPALYDVEATDEEKRKGILWLALTKFTQSGAAKVNADLGISRFSKFSERNW